MTQDTVLASVLPNSNWVRAEKQQAFLETMSSK
jgi:hypothetical protein